MFGKNMINRCFFLFNRWLVALSPLETLCSVRLTSSTEHRVSTANLEANS